MKEMESGVNKNNEADLLDANIESGFKIG